MRNSFVNELKKTGTWGYGGFAYGEQGGCQVAVDQKISCVNLWIYLYPSTLSAEEAAAADEQALAVLQDCDLKAMKLTGKEAFAVGGGFARVSFPSGFKTLKNLNAYAGEILPKLAALDLGGDRCAYCGERLGGDVAHVALNGFVLPVHSGCSREVVNQSIIESGEPKQGSALLGLLGALLGAVIGAIPWAVVYMLGYITSIIGFVIGYLANFLYGKLGGKKSPVRIFAVVLALVLGVALGQIGGYTLDFNKEYSAASGMSRKDFIVACWENYLIYDQATLLGKEYDVLLSQLEPGTDMSTVMTRDEFIDTYSQSAIEDMQQEMRSAFVKDGLMGVGFGVLGCVGLFGQLRGEERGRKARELA